MSPEIYCRGDEEIKQWSMGKNKPGVWYKYDL